jgi:hypothetical protein
MNAINVNITQVNPQPQVAVDQDPGMTLANYVFTIS